MQEALTVRTVVAGKGESYKVPLKQDDARDGCDAFAKEIYQQVFDWLVRNINTQTCAQNNYQDAGDVEEYGLIGLLDIFGFESFKVNRFEQLCINYTNEKLQQKYTLDIFRSVQEEYAHEGIELGEISFSDNAEVLRLIEGKIGIISVLNEECVRPKGNDAAFVSKVKSVNKDVSCLISEKLHKPTEFAIQHYAGPVTYDATNFVQKNSDALPRDMIECACMSTNEIIKTEVKAAADIKAGRTAKRGAATLTVTTKFKSQLARLMVDITQTKTRYIRCIKPNPNKAPLKMEMSSAAEQLRCAGVVAAVTISRVAFPNRLMHETALERFSCLGRVSVESLFEQRKESSDDDETGYREIVGNLFGDLLKDMEKTDDGGKVTKAFECGRSRIYFRLGALESLEAQRLLALGVFATSIERIVRGFTARSVFLKLKSATRNSQANARRVVARKKFLRSKNASIGTQCWTRCVFAKRELKRRVRNKAATRIESKWRTIMAVIMLRKCKKASVVVQKTVRGALQRPKYRVALKEAEEEARVNSKLAALQKRLHDAEMKFFQADKKRIAAEKRAGGAPVDASDDDAVEENTPPPSTSGGEVAEEKKDATGQQQKELMDESNEMLEYFRKEVFKLKSANYLLRTDLSALQEDHRALQSHAESTEASYSAMTHNFAKLSTNNMRLAHQLADEKEFIQKLKKDLKMDKIRHNGELMRKDEEILGRNKMSEVEVARLKRDLNRYRQAIEKAGGEVPKAEESKAGEGAQKPMLEHNKRANFHRDSFQDSLLRSLNVQKGVESSLATAATSSARGTQGYYSQSSDGEEGMCHSDRSGGGGYSRRRPSPINMQYSAPNDFYGSPRATPPRYGNSLQAAAGRGGRGRGSGRGRGRGRGRGGYSPSGYASPAGYASPSGYASPHASLNATSPAFNPGSSLGAAAKPQTPSSLAAQAKSGSSLAAAATGTSSSLSSAAKKGKQ